jgi:hypothetical protein
MLLRHRAPKIDAPPLTTTTNGDGHLDEKPLALLRWLKENRVDFVLVGAVAQAIRGETGARGPVSIVPAPYGRNLDRLARALTSAHARPRVGDGVDKEPSPIKMTAEKLVGSQRWSLRCGVHDLDVEGRPKGVPRYQELLYESARLELAPDLHVEVASPEDVEHYDHVRRTGAAPEIRITRKASVENA